MIEAETVGKTRAKPRNKKPTAFDDAEDADDFGGRKKVKRRRGPQKRRDAVDDEEDEPKAFKEMEQLALGPDSLHLMQHLHEGQRYDHDPRLLPDIDGVTCLSNHEAHMDIKSIQQQLAKFEARSGIKLPDGRPIVGDKDHRRLFLVDENGSDDDLAPLALSLKNRRARPSGVIAPEEIVETLPAARRAVRITQRELRAMMIEREDLERAYVRHRYTLLWQVGEMKRMQKQHDRVARALGREVVQTAKELESSRRRTSALQDIMTELETRGSKVLRLTREKSRLEALLEANDIELPEIDEVCVGDRVKCAPFGTGRVMDLRLDTRQLVVKLDFGGVGYIQEDNVEVLPSDTTYEKAEEELKQRFFEKIGKLAQPNGKLRLLNGTVEYPRDDSDDEEDSDEDSEESSSSEDESGATPGDEYVEESSQRRGKKRRLIMTPTPGTSSKKSKNRRVIEFPASTVPITPYDVGLLISPLSELPERVAAVGPNALQWLPSYLPKNMDEWEQERYNSLQMKGEIERLRFQLQKSEAQRIDAQQLASDQLESINQLVSQLDKLRENAGLPPSNALHADACPTCGSHKASRNASHGRGSNSHRKDSGAKQDDSDDELSETNSKNSRAGDNDSVHSDSRRTPKRKHSGADTAADEAGNESSDTAPPRTKGGRGGRLALSTAIVAYAAIAFVALAIAKFVYLHFVCKTDLTKYGAKQGAWALITGSREGIGKGFAVALASKGFNVVLVARNAEGLKAVASQIEQQYKVQTKVIAVDAGADNAVETVVDGVKDCDLRVLVNNVGVNTTFPTVLAETDKKDVQGMVGINCLFTTLLTRALIPQLTKSKASLVYMLSSFSGSVPVPMMSVYSATKAYNDAFARALAGELAPAGVTVKSIVPHYVVSAMSGFSRPSWSVPDGTSFARAALDKTSYPDVSIAPHWFHDVTTRIAAALPDSIVGKQGLQTMKVVRTKLQRRAEKAALTN